MSHVQTITVLGAGTMGHGVAHAAAASGFATRLYDPSSAQLEKARAQIDAVFRKSVELGKMSAGDADAGMARLATSSQIADALSGADLVIEAAPERMDLKLQLMGEIE